jgi:hypothetical protein
VIPHPTQINILNPLYQHFKIFKVGIRIINFSKVLITIFLLFNYNANIISCFTKCKSLVSFVSCIAHIFCISNPRTARE